MKIVFSEGSGLNDSVYGKCQAPTCPLILNAQRLQPSPLCIFSFLSTK